MSEILLDYGSYYSNIPTKGFVYRNVYNPNEDTFQNSANALFGFR